jgi:hypothetical protein
MSLHQNSKLLLVHGKRCLVSQWPPAFEIGMLRKTTFVELRVKPKEPVSRPMLIHTCMPCCAVSLRSLFQSRSTAWARQGHCVACVNQTRSHCVNQMGKTQSKPLAARHVRGTAWARHAMCELAFSVTYSL